jgi:D-alanyl-D-alanine carboxypeptidase
MASAKGLARLIIDRLFGDAGDQRPPLALCSMLSFFPVLLVVIGCGSSTGQREQAGGAPNRDQVAVEMTHGQALSDFRAEFATAPVMSASYLAPTLETTVVVPIPPAEPTTAPPPPTATPTPSVAPVVLAPPPAVEAEAYAVIERECGTLLWGKGENEALPPASITKIITALVVVESVGLDEMAVSTVSGSAMKERGSSVMGVEPGMELSVRDLLYGLMLKSGNDAALVLAEHVGHGSVETFVEAMNAKAAALGMTNTHFANPHGLDNREHYSSAADMAKAGVALLANPVLAEISVAPEYHPEWDGSNLRNGNKLLDRYDGAYGIKIGYTRRANQTIVAAAEHDGRHIIVSLFGSEDRYTDSAELLDWAFTKTEPACGQPAG